VVAAYTNASARSDPQLATQLEPVLASPNMLYLISGDRLFACSVRPLYFGSEASGALLGYVISGFAIDRSLVDSDPAGPPWCRLPLSAAAAPWRAPSLPRRRIGW